MDHQIRKYLSVVLVASSILFFGVFCHLGATPLDDELRVLAKGVCTGLLGKGIERLAVTDFTSITGEQDTTTKYLTEQFTTAVVAEKRKFQVVDRSHLSSTVLAELKAEDEQKHEGFLNPATLSKFGKILGADGILVGTVTVLRSAVVINIKVLNVETASIQLALKGSVSIPQFAGQTRPGEGIQASPEILPDLLVEPTPPSRTVTPPPKVPVAGKETRQQKKLRQKIEKAEKRKQKAAKRAAAALADAAIAGCAPGTVRVNLRAVGNASSNFFISKSAAKMRVINLHTSPIDVSDESGVVVHNLCSGGSITLSRGYSSFFFSNSNQRVEYHYIATGKFPDGSLGTQRSQTVSLSVYRNGLQNLTWEVRLRKVR